MLRTCNIVFTGNDYNILHLLLLGDKNNYKHKFTEL